MITKKFIKSVRELIPRTPAEKKVDLLLFPLAVLLFSTSVRHRILKKKKEKTITHESKCCGVSGYFIIVGLSKK